MLPLFVNRVGVQVSGPIMISSIEWDTFVCGSVMCGLSCSFTAYGLGWCNIYMGKLRNGGKEYFSFDYGRVGKDGECLYVWQSQY